MNKPKVVIVGAEARQKLIKGANLLADAVKSTLGSFGMNTVFGVRGIVEVSNDGVKTAEQVWSADEIENLGIRLLREAAIKTNEKVGDGTTTATTLAQGFMATGELFLQKKGDFKGKMAPVAFAKQMTKEVEEAIKLLKPEPVTSKEELIGIARVSVEDENLAELIGGTQWELGPEGTIIAEETNDLTDSIERTRGVRIDNGFGTSLMLNNAEKQLLEVEDASIILTNYALSGQEFLQIDQLLKRLAEKGITKVILIARGFTQDVIQHCMKSHSVGFYIYPINAPYENQTQVMLDLAAVTGARFINEEQMQLSNAGTECVGEVDKIQAGRFHAVITGKINERTDKATKERLTQLEKELKGEESEFIKKNIQGRISQLKDGFALVKVGGTSLVERKYKKDKVDDCVNATKLALKYGTVKGGGVALKDISDSLPETSLIKSALRTPYDQIQTNAGGNLEIPEWVKDPVEVVKTALQIAASVAAQIATVNVAIDWANEKPKYVQETEKGE